MNLNIKGAIIGSMLLGTTLMKAQEIKIDSILASGVFTVEVTRIQPVRSSSVNANTIYTLRLTKDSVYSNLPYIGRSYYSVTMQNEGLSMEEPIKKYRIQTKGDGTREVFFDVRNQSDCYSYRLKVLPNGVVRIHISMFNKQPIFYDGHIKRPETAL